MANLRFRVLPRFPARLFADGGLSVVKDGADWTISPDWGLLSVLSSVADPANTEVWVRVTSAGVSTYFRMTLSALLSSVTQTGAGYSFAFTFDTTTTDADPGNGVLRLDQAVQNTATQAFVDLADAGGVDITAILDSLDDSTNVVKGNWSLTKIGDATKRILGTLSAVTSVAGYRKLVIAVTGSSAASPFLNGDSVLFSFVRAGDSGSNPNPIVLPEGAAPSTPSAGNVAVYAKADGRTYEKDDAGVERGLSSVGKHTIGVPAGAMRAKGTNGATITSYNDVTAFSFSATTAQYVRFSIPMPKSAAESGTMTFIPQWVVDTGGSAAQTGIFTLAGTAVSHDDAFPATTVLTGTQSSSGTWTADDDLIVGAESSAITINGSWAEGDLIVFELGRDIADTLGSAAILLIAIKIIFTTNAATDD